MTRERRAFARAISLSVGKSDLVSKLRPTNNGEYQIVAALPKEKTGDVFSRISRLDGYVNIIVKMDVHRFAVLTVAKDQRSDHRSKGRTGASTQKVHPDTEFGLLINLLQLSGQVENPISGGVERIQITLPGFEALVSTPQEMAA